ncbi:hypothetical protein ANN_01933, partial [Periplaneta americana]
AQHSIEKEHKILFDHTKVINKSSHYWDCTIKEAIEIKLEKNNFNRDGGLQLSQAWTPALDQLRPSYNQAPPLIPGPNYELLPELGYYKFYPARVNWFLARETCMKEGAYLLVLNSEKEFQAIKKMWETHPKVTNDWKDDVIHVGITDHKIEGQFYTIFGLVKNCFQNVGDVIVGGRRIKCVRCAVDMALLAEEETVLRDMLLELNGILVVYFQVSLDHGPTDEHDGIWHVDVDHTTTKCEKSETVHVVATVTAPFMRPGPNYEFVPELGYYKFHPITVDWYVARRTCAKEGAYLMVLSSEKEFQAIRKIWDRQPKLTNDWRNDFIHVGLTDHETEGQFYSIFGRTVSVLQPFENKHCLNVRHVSQQVIASQFVHLQCYMMRGAYVRPSMASTITGFDSIGLFPLGSIFILAISFDNCYQVSLDHGPSDEYNGIWHVDVDHTTTKCERSETVHLVATVTGSTLSHTGIMRYLCCVAPSLKPGPNYEFLPELGYYKFHPITVDWNVARETCMKEGAHLLVLNSEKEFQAVKKIWDRQPKLTNDWTNDYLQVGLTDHETEGQFYSIFGEHVNTTGYAIWKAGEPNSGTGVNCAAVNRGGELYDSYCTRKLAFVCEQKL